MTPQTLSLTEAARNFSDCINRVAYRGESFLLLRGRRPVAELRPAPVGRRLTDLPAIFATLPPLPESEVAAWKRDLARSRR
ncbi:MAG: hypothetical protein OHK005_16800 [Candidatus Methylacidiphilales bacterium]